MLIDFIKALGKEIKWHGRAKDESAHYCVNCEVSYPWRCIFVLRKNECKVTVNFPHDELTWSRIS